MTIQTPAGLRYPGIPLAAFLCRHGQAARIHPPEPGASVFGTTPSAYRSEPGGATGACLPCPTLPGSSSPRRQTTSHSGMISLLRAVWQLPSVRRAGPLSPLLRLDCCCLWLLYLPQLAWCEVQPAGSSNRMPCSYRSTRSTGTATGSTGTKMKPAFRSTVILCCEHRLPHTDR
jgi:hypothetical protein